MLYISHLGCKQYRHVWEAGEYGTYLLNRNNKVGEFRVSKDFYLIGLN